MEKLHISLLDVLKLMLTAQYLRLGRMGEEQCCVQRKVDNLVC